MAILEGSRDYVGAVTDLWNVKASSLRAKRALLHTGSATAKE